MTTRRSFLSTLAVSLALCRFRLPPAEASLGTAPPMESLIVKGMKFTHDSQLWKYLRYKRLTFLDCTFIGVHVESRLWSFDGCTFRDSTVNLNRRKEPTDGTDIVLRNVWLTDTKTVVYCGVTVNGMVSVDTSKPTWFTVVGLQK